MAATHHSLIIKKDSQNYLTTALLQLLETHDLNTITVTQVVKRAGVSRMAFYRNFTTLDELLMMYFKPAIAARFQDIFEHVPTDQKLIAIGKFFSDFGPTLKISTNRGFEHIIRQLFNENMTMFYRQIMAAVDISPIRLNYWIEFMSAGVYNIWREWLLTNQTEPLTTIHDLIAILQQSTMKALLSE
ncbi:Transcriptional regulator, TetR family [Leuconostoc gelidum subsp. gasicomitatum]|uniref:Transcriptional regulator, TetR family n=2 Tax=Leuconostoc TaxID=1243 RepID=A0ABP2B1Q8_9LACO|nr:MULTISPECIES: TetR/AcrR family transcriptional regulator [Leuconostoc gelidum group]MBZ5953144.1 TetR/AcrR family transcriptional regulator [Leuconostoc gasicomitatum]MBZ5988598.1 TetR/AcrR family transcriptional regulator [Leuconostoc gasicomitatum]MBZ5990863.1 TetR/AcrR family transcriptional regulator [Leuconostoc gasicomitatum]MBZ6009260.1 TetR/AcrR family transcriptional regulator [Leuconostoc gelidum subsp. aenigmaticum]CUR62643.1 Transcriptional regulator TetR family [Leuconostoc gas